MMDKMQILKTPSLPPQGVGFYLVNGVPSRRRPETADRIPANSAIDFSGSSDVKRRTLLELFAAVNEIADNAASNAKLRILRKVLEAPFKIIGIERQITIKFDNKVPILHF